VGPGDKRSPINSFESSGEVIGAAARALISAILAFQLPPGKPNEKPESMAKAKRREFLIAIFKCTMNQ
jgi:hypothetical protein